MSTLALPLPLNDDLVQGKDRRRYPKPDDVDPNEYRIDPLWAQALIQQQAAINASPSRVNTVQLKDQAASIAPTDMSGGVLAAGFYRAMWYATVSIAGDGASSVSVTLDFTDRGQAKSRTYSVIAGSSTGTFAQDGGVIRVDKASPVRYSTTYAAGGGTPLKYDLVLVLERVNA